jgi:hypothetical protein
VKLGKPAGQTTPKETTMETQEPAPGGEERRRNHKLRGIFPDARIRINHFFHARTDWAGSPTDYLALRVIHEAYPELSSDEVRVLMNAIERRVQWDTTPRAA